MSPHEQQPFEHPENLPTSGEPLDLRHSLSELLGELELVNTKDQDALITWVMQQGEVSSETAASRNILTGREQIIKILRAHLEMSGPEADAYIRKMLSEEPGE